MCNVSDKGIMEYTIGTARLFGIDLMRNFNFLISHAKLPSSPYIRRGRDERMEVGESQFL